MSINRKYLIFFLILVDLLMLFAFKGDIPTVDKPFIKNELIKNNPDLYNPNPDLFYSFARLNYKEKLDKSNFVSINFVDSTKKINSFDIYYSFDGNNFWKFSYNFRKSKVDFKIDTMFRKNYQLYFLIDKRYSLKINNFQFNQTYETTSIFFELLLSDQFSQILTNDNTPEKIIFRDYFWPIIYIILLLVVIIVVRIDLHMIKKNRHKKKPEYHTEEIPITRFIPVQDYRGDKLGFDEIDKKEQSEGSKQKPAQEKTTVSERKKVTDYLKKVSSNKEEMITVSPAQDLPKRVETKSVEIVTEEPIKPPIIEKLSFLEQYNQWLEEGASPLESSIKSSYPYQDLEYSDDKLTVSLNPSSLWLFTDQDKIYVLPSYHQLNTVICRSLYEIEDTNGKDMMKWNKIIKIKSLTKVNRKKKKLTQIVDHGIVEYTEYFVVQEKGTLVCSE